MGYYANLAKYKYKVTIVGSVQANYELYFTLSNIHNLSLGQPARKLLTTCYSRDVLRKTVASMPDKFSSLLPHWLSECYFGAHNVLKRFSKLTIIICTQALRLKMTLSHG